MMFYPYMLFLLSSLKKSSAELKKILTNGQVLKFYTLFICSQYIVLINMIDCFSWYAYVSTVQFFLLHYISVLVSY